jgi:hypothetical protein
MRRPAQSFVPPSLPFNAVFKATASHAMHFLVEAALGILGVIALAGCVLGWRLAQGPIDITWLAQREQRYLTGNGAQLAIGHAALAWEGFVDPGSAIDIRWTDVVVTARDGALLARLPQGRVALSVSRLVFGQITPRDIEIEGAAISLLRRSDGTIALDIGQSGAVSSGAASKPDTPGAQRLLQDLTDTGPGASLPFLSQLSTLRIRKAVVDVRDEALGALWQAHSATIDLQRVPHDGIEGQAQLDLQAGDAHALLTAQATLTAGGTHFTADATPISPAALARAIPALAQGAAVNAPLQGRVDAVLGPDFAVKTATLTLRLGAGTVQAGKGVASLRDASVSLVLQANSVRAKDVRIDFQPAPNAHLPPPVVTASAVAVRANGHVRADFAVNIDRASFADLPAYWPLGTGGGARPWIVANIPSGTAQNGHVTGTVETDEGFSNIVLTALAGGVQGTDVSMSWLKPVPGLVHADAKLTLQGPESLLIEVPRAMQLAPPPATGTIAVSNGAIEITGLQNKDQYGQIDLKGNGALRDVLALLNVKRLGLLSRRPLPMSNPSGSAAMTLSVHLPLDDRITFDDVGIKGTAHLMDVHLGGVAAGRDLDHGKLDLTADVNALKITGTGDIAAIPATLGVDMNFRNGPPDQVLEHYSATGTATPADLEASGLPAGVLTSGHAGLSVDYTDRRDGTGTVDVAMNLQDAAIATPIGWSKAAGPAANASARLGLINGRITSIDRLHASGPDLAVTSHAYLKQGEGTVLQLDKITLGRTDAHGTIGLPHRQDDPLRLTLHGSSLDISAFLTKRNGKRTADDEKPGQRWIANLAFDRVILAKDETLAPMTLQAQSDGVHISRAEVRAGTKGEVKVSITPVAGGRTLAVDSADAGAVLLTAGIADNIRGGKLQMNGFYNDNLPHSPLKGTATLEQFRITDAPAIGRLLKAMTLYGAFDLLRGPGLGFQKAVAPFQYERQVLTLDNARAFSASLGLTAKGTIDLIKHTADVTGTIVPAYFFNQLPGWIPVLGKLFSPETGGGVFAARYSVRGPLDNPKVGVNPLAALTPGFLRGIFGFFAAGQNQGATK